MKQIVFCIALFLTLSDAHSQMPWTSPVQLTTGNIDDLHPAFASKQQFSTSYDIEWLAFSRGYPGSTSRDICVMRTSAGGTLWEDSIIFLTQDSLIHDYPSVAMGDDDYPWTWVSVVWVRDSSGQKNIYYSQGDGVIGYVWSWSAPRPLVEQIGQNIDPAIARDLFNRWVVAWVRDGSVLFCRIGWTNPEYITSGGDVGNSSPDLQYVFDTVSPMWVAVWEKEKSGSAEHALMYSLRTASGWSPPAILTQEGDNRNPKFFKASPYSYLINVSWESNRTGDWETYTLDGYVYGDSITWHVPATNESFNPIANDNHAAFQVSPIITQRGTVQSYYTSGAWVTTSGTGDSIALRAMDDWNTQYRTPAPGTLDRNPDISSGIFTGSSVRVWAVWENNASGKWKLYGVTKEIVLDVEEDHDAPYRFNLMQNYPNPFNPGTEIGFRIKDKGFVTLKVYDILGREIAMLVNGKMEAGEHRVTFDAQGLPSGVYIYRIQAGEYSASRKMVVIK